MEAEPPGSRSGPRFGGVPGSAWSSSSLVSRLVGGPVERFGRRARPLGLVLGLRRLSTGVGAFAGCFGFVCGELGLPGLLLPCRVGPTPGVFALDVLLVPGALPLEGDLA